MEESEDKHTSRERRIKNCPSFKVLANKCLAAQQGKQSTFRDKEPVFWAVEQSILFCPSLKYIFIIIVKACQDSMAVSHSYPWPF